MRRRRQFMTLLELIIGMSLMMLLLTIMTYFYKNIITLDAEAEYIQNENFRISYLESRLKSIVPKILPEYRIKKNKIENFIFYTTYDAPQGLAANSPSLLFTYQTGVDILGQHSQYVLGRFFLDRDDRFCLATWSVPEEWQAHITPSMKKEVLFEGVESIAFQFFVPPEKNPVPLNKSFEGKTIKPKIQIKDIPGAGLWLSEWRREYHRLPAMIKILLTLKEKPGSKKKEQLVLAFPLPRSKYIVMYEQ